MFREEDLQPTGLSVLNMNGKIVPASLLMNGGRESGDADRQCSTDRSISATPSQNGDDHHQVRFLGVSGINRCSRVVGCCVCTVVRALASYVCIERNNGKRKAIERNAKGSGPITKSLNRISLKTTTANRVLR
uniref:Uncharacterized protein n=1 Tax=Heterorhabditis bacteriophora TaxID=37862 RepID=A0A1I7XBQ3_HETBA